MTDTPDDPARVAQTVAKWQARMDGADVGHRRMRRAIRVQHRWMMACIAGALLVVPLPLTLAGLAWAMWRCRQLRREVYGE